MKIKEILIALGKGLILVSLYIFLMFTIFGCSTYEQGVHSVEAKQIIRKSFPMGKFEEHVIINKSGNYMLLKRVPKNKKDSIYTYYLKLDYSESRKGKFEKICLN